jgi:hypothetical protein
MKDQVIRQTSQTLAIHSLADEESGLTTIKQVINFQFVLMKWPVNRVNPYMDLELQPSAVRARGY